MWSNNTIWIFKKKNIFYSPKCPLITLCFDIHISSYLQTDCGKPMLFITEKVMTFSKILSQLNLLIWIDFRDSLATTLNPIRPGLLIHKPDTDQHIFPKLCTSCSTYFSQKKKKKSYSTSRNEYKLRRTYKCFAILGHFNVMHGKKVNARKIYM